MKQNIRITERDRSDKPRTAFCVALGGTITSLVLLLMFMATAFPVLDYAIPTYAGFLIVVVIVEAGAGWAFVTYCACALLCPLLTPDYEATLLFILFMGYYPILYVYLMRIKNLLLRVLLKLAVFNAAILGYASVFKFIFTSVDLMEGTEMFGKWAGPAMLALANFFLIIYDSVLGMLITKYIGWFRKKVLKRK